MPIDYSKYPSNWKEIRARILERAGSKCEQCKAVNHDWVWRGTANSKPIYQTAELNVYCAETGEHLSETGMDISMDVGENGDKLTRIVLTIAHKCHTSMCVNEEHLLALCQKCHNAMDRPMRIMHARQTRQKRKGQLAAFYIQTTQLSCDTTCTDTSDCLFG